MRKMYKMGGIGIVVALVLFGVFALFAWGLDAFYWLRKERWETAPLAKTAVERTPLAERQRLRIDRLRFYSEEMQSPRFCLVLVPKTDKPVDEVFILNHGWFDRPEFLLKYLKVDQVYERLLGEGKVRPALVVMPDVRFPDYFRRNRDRYPFPQYLTLVAEEVVGAVSREYGIPVRRDKWSLGGFSFGGYLSLDIGRRYPGRFHSVSVVSSFTEEDWRYWPEKDGPPGYLDAKGRGRQTVVDPGPMPKLFLACGTGDRFFSKAVELHEKFTKLGIPHEWSTGPGGHTWKYWSTVLEPMLRFHLGL